MISRFHLHAGGPSQAPQGGLPCQNLIMGLSALIALSCPLGDFQPVGMGPPPPTCCSVPGTKGGSASSADKHIGGSLMRLLSVGGCQSRWFLVALSPETSTDLEKLRKTHWGHRVSCAAQTTGGLAVKLKVRTALAPRV